VNVSLIRPSAIRLTAGAALVAALVTLAGCATKPAQDGTVLPPKPAGPARLHAVDGGLAYYARFSPSLPVSPDFFPIGVWLASVTSPAQVRSDHSIGLNMYVTLTDNSLFSALGRTPMYVISNQPRLHLPGTVGWYVMDEADMWAGPGTAPWTGNYPGGGPICRPKSASCGYTVEAAISSRLPHDTLFRYANYGKGVTFWETRAQAARFVTRYQDVVSADNYWFTDDDICVSSEGARWFGRRALVAGNLRSALCHLAANYGLTVRKMRALAQDRIPVWAYVELGHPSTENNWPTITPSEVYAAVWQSLIAGARGIIYFNHSFGGKCQTDNVLRDPCYARVRAMVALIDRRITELAPVLNAPSASDILTTTGNVTVATKWANGHFYLLAGSAEPMSQTVTFRMPCVGSAAIRVLFERRTIQATGGEFHDYFANGNAIHIYEVDGGGSCGLTAESRNQSLRS
jgi:hypothetical protein